MNLKNFWIFKIFESRFKKIWFGGSRFFQKCDFEPESRFMNPESDQLYRRATQPWGNRKSKMAAASSVAERPLPYLLQTFVPPPHWWRLAWREDKEQKCEIFGIKNLLTGAYKMLKTVMKIKVDLFWWGDRLSQNGKSQNVFCQNRRCQNGKCQNGIGPNSLSLKNRKMSEWILSLHSYLHNRKMSEQNWS